MAKETALNSKLKAYRKAIAKRLGEAMAMKGMNQTQFSKMSDIKLSYLNRVLQGEANLTLQTICKIELALGYPLIEIPSKLIPAGFTGEVSGELIGTTKPE